MSDVAAVEGIGVTDNERGPSRPQRDKDGLHKRGRVWHYKLKVAGVWREFSTHTKNYREARQKYQKAMQDQAAGRLPTDMAKWPFERAATEWLAGRKNVVAPQTQRIERERMRPLLEAFSGKRLGDIASGDLHGFQIARAAKVSPRTVNLELKVLRMVLKRAKLWARVSEDYKPLKENAKGPGRALSDAEETRLFSVACSKPDWEVAFWASLLAANTGLRNCEVRGLTLGKIDLTNRSLSIRRTTTKTDAGCRIVPLNEQAIWAATRLLERARKLGASAADHYLLPFAQYRCTKLADPSTGTRFDVTRPMKGWRTAWRSLTRAADLRGLRFHDLRHHFITKHLENGTPEQTLMSMVGHISRQMLEHYSHIRMERKRQAVAAVQVNAAFPADERLASRSVN